MTYCHERCCSTADGFANLPSTVVFEAGVEPKQKKYSAFIKPEGLKPSTVAVDFAVDDVGCISGIPEEHIVTRTAHIFKPAKYATQAGTNHTHRWKIEFDNRERWESPLIGWCSK
ncbi:unnamed protein product [Soboliphyme baturini]|uniref:NADH dehydrogenase [ubiquinone] iron-sulfur protein 4, mitochondrial n=1 Tax=Soboliphyme baturini TaxID=241478 RepID=A0A183J4K3_9BILA|nr:unnamed protein product [Soboliphyme baturini]